VGVKIGLLEDPFSITIQENVKVVFKSLKKSDFFCLEEDLITEWQGFEIAEPLITLEKGLKIHSVGDDGVQEAVVDRRLGGIAYATEKYQKAAVDYLDFLIKSELALGSLLLDAVEAKASNSPIGFFLGGIVRVALMKGQAEKLQSVEVGCLLDQSLEVGCHLLHVEDAEKLVAPFKLKKNPRKKLRRLVTELKDAFGKCSQMHERAYRAAEGVVELEFLAAEYIKRRFVQDLRRDDTLREKARSVSSVLRSLYGIWMKEAPAHCADCVWANGEGEVVQEYSFLNRGPGCGSRMCEFKIRISKGIDLFAEAVDQSHTNEVGEFKLYDLPAEPDTAVLVDEAFELANTYGLYPYDLLTLARIGCAFSVGDSFPKPNFYSMPIADKRQKSAKSSLSKLELIRQTRKKQFGSEKFHETVEGRLVGIWLWDQLNLSPKESRVSIIDTVHQLFYQYWFWDIPMGKVDCEAYCKAVDKLGYRGVINRRRNEFNLARECINRGKLVPFSAIKRKSTT